MIKPSHKLTDSVSFILITVIFLFTRLITFRGFNGTDDLHYGLLSYKMLHGQFSPFVQDDIFSGRMLLIFWQSIIYYFTGITSFGTQIGAILCTVLCCYLTLFHLLRKRTATKIILAAAIFYFNPVISEASLGIMPDPYVMLTCILVILFWRSSFEKDQSKINLYKRGCVMGLFIGLSLLIKEINIMFIPLIFLISVIYYKSKGLYFSVFMSCAFLLIIAGMGFFYYHYTGNFFFRVTQVNNSNYANPCNVLSLKRLAIRTTYGPWINFTIQGYYPVILAALGVLLQRIFYDKRFFKTPGTEGIFIILLFVSLYFPFNLHRYQPLCSNARQFLALLPFGTIILTNIISDAFSRKGSWPVFAIVSFSALLAVIELTLNKWMWMTYLFLFLSGFGAWIFPFVRLNIKLLFFFILIWITSLERIFFWNSNWFFDLRSLNQQLSGEYCYFPDHDNFMHWRLFNHFRDDRAFSIEKAPFWIFRQYYPPNPSFKKGWFIVNRSYTIRSTEFFVRLDSLSRKGFFLNEKKNGDVSAYQINYPFQLDSLKSILNKEP